MKPGFVYMMANRKDGTLYTGATSDLVQRVHQHRTRAVSGFTATFGCDRLVWFEPCASIEDARIVEARMKKWNRQWKVRRIVERNPEWADLFDVITR